MYGIPKRSKVKELKSFFSIKVTALLVVSDMGVGRIGPRFAWPLTPTRRTGNFQIGFRL